MPRDPGEVFQSVVDIDDEQKWRLRLSTVVEVKSGYTDKRKDAVYLSWHFTVHDMNSGVAVIDEATGKPFELWHSSNDATFFNPDTKKMGGAREVGNVLMGRDLTDDEVRGMNAEGIEGWAEAMASRTAIADVEWRQTEKGFNRLYVLRLRPDPQGLHTRTVSAPKPGAPAAPAAKNGSTSAAESAADRRARLMAEIDAMNEAEAAADGDSDSAPF